MRQGFVVSIIVSIIFCPLVLAVNGDMGLSTELLTDGSAEHPYLIEDLADFDTFTNDPNYWAASVHTKLMTDIDLAGRTYTTAVIAPDTDSDSGWDGTEFRGNFDGNSHVVRNLTIDGLYYCGLFGKLTTGSEVKNLSVEDIYITGNNRVAGLVGYNYKGSIMSSHSTGVVTGNNSSIGGLVGSNGSSGIISNCSSTATVTGDDSVGGLVGYNNYHGSISNSHSTGSVTGDDRVGGLVGYNDRDGSIANSYSTGAVKGDDYVGGLVGYNEIFGSITSCNSTGAVTGDDRVGGLVGNNDVSGSITSCNSTGAVTGDDYVGGLVGDNEGSIASSNSAGAVNGDYSVGGLVGYNDRGSITSNYSTSVVTGNNYIGGLVGENNSGSITGNYSTGTVTGNGSIGGLVGLNNYGPIMSNYSTGEVTGGNYVGGLVGHNDCYGSIINSYSTGAVTGDDRVGGLVGYNEYKVSITSSYSTGMATGSGSIGGLIGFNNTGNSVVSSYFYKYSGQDNGYGIALDDEQLQEKGSFAGFDFTGDDADGTEDVWSIESGYMPRLSWQDSPGFEAPYILDTIITILSGTGYPSDPFIIGSYRDLMEFRTNSTLRIGHYRLETDIDLADVTFSDAFIPENFYGSFSGNGHTISSLTIEGIDYLGFLSILYGSVDNLTLEDVYIAGNDFVGGLVGNSKGSIKSSHSTGVVTGNDFAGGLVGHNDYHASIASSHSTEVVTGNDSVGGLVGYNNYHGSISNSHSTGPVTGKDCVGGLIGENKGNILSSHSTGSVTGTDYVGGLVGENSGNILSSFSAGVVTGNDCVGGLTGIGSSGSISNSYSTGMVTGNDYVGGLLGYNSADSITSSYSMGPVTGRYYIGGLGGRNYFSHIMNSYSTGAVAGIMSVGGLVGDNDRGGIIKSSYSTGTVEGRYSIGGLVGDNDRDGIIKSSFWDVETSGIGFTGDDNYGAIGKSTFQMQDINTFMVAGWDFFFETENGTEDIWFIRDCIYYPKLWWEHHRPVANAGEDLTAYAYVDGYAKVQLDGTGSYDPDEDVLEYYWFDANELIATGAEPNVVLPVGVHEITLFVNDGIEDSEPNDVVITVIQLLEVPVKLTPATLNCRSRGDWVIAHFILPEEYSIADIDPNRTAVVDSYGIESAVLEVVFNKKENFLEITAFFNREAICSLAEDWPQVFRVYGFFTDGSVYFGEAGIRLNPAGLKEVSEFASSWLLGDCVEPDWCGGMDLNRDTQVNMQDYPLLLNSEIEFTAE